MKRLWTPAWIVRHVLTVVMVIAFLALGWWQTSRAIAGHTLSWAYAVEWPIFAGFLIFLWAREVRYALRGRQTSTTDPDADGTGSDAATGSDLPVTGSDASGAGPAVPVPGSPAGRSPAAAPGIRRPVRTTRHRLAATNGDDPALAEYNHYLAWLNANPEARPADYPGYPGPVERKDTSWAQP